MKATDTVLLNNTITQNPMTEPTYGYELSLKSGANSKSYIRYSMFCSLPLIFMRQA